MCCLNIVTECMWLYVWRDATGRETETGRGSSLGLTQARHFAPCPSTFDPQSPLSLTSLSSPSGAQARYTSLACHGWKSYASVHYCCLCMPVVHEHRHSCATWPWSIIMRITPPCIIKKSRIVRMPYMTKTTQNNPQKSQRGHSPSLCAATVLRLDDVWTRGYPAQAWLWLEQCSCSAVGD